MLTFLVFGEHFERSFGTINLPLQKSSSKYCIELLVVLFKPLEKKG